MEQIEHIILQTIASQIIELISKNLLANTELLHIPNDETNRTMWPGSLILKRAEYFDSKGTPCGTHITISTKQSHLSVLIKQAKMKEIWSFRSVASEHHNLSYHDPDIIQKTIQIILDRLTPHANTKTE